MVTAAVPVMTSIDEESDFVTICVLITAEEIIQRPIEIGIATEDREASGTLLLNSYSVYTMGTVIIKLGKIWRGHLLTMPLNTAPSDYLQLNITLTVPSGSNETCANISIVSDDQLEGNETFVVLLTSSDSNIEFGNIITMVTISDNDCK